MPMQTSQELFLHELADIYDAEHRIQLMLAALIKECADTDAASALEHHLEETKEQISNLEQCFKALGETPRRETCAAIDGMKKEHDAFLKEKPSAPILVMFNLGGASKTEHYEIASYRGLIDQATLLGQTECVTLLKQNLEQEEAMAKKVEALAKKQGKQLAKK